MYMRRNVGVIALIHSSTFHMPSLFTQISLKYATKFYKIQINLVKSKENVYQLFLFFSYLNKF